LKRLSFGRAQILFMDGCLKYAERPDGLTPALTLTLSPGEGITPARFGCSMDVVANPVDETFEPGRDGARRSNKLTPLPCPFLLQFAPRKT